MADRAASTYATVCNPLIGILLGVGEILVWGFGGWMVASGKGLSYGGSLARREATGYGLCYFTDLYYEGYCTDFEKLSDSLLLGQNQSALWC